MSVRATRRPFTSALTAVVAAMVVAVAGGCEAGGDDESAAPMATGSGAAVIVPLGSVPQHSIAVTARRLEAMGFAPTVAPARDAVPGSIDPDRRQRVADTLMDQVFAAVPGVGGEGAPLVVGLTTQDMYWVDRPEWRFVFALRQGPHGGVLSTARMDDRFFGMPADRRREDRRLDAMLVRVVGLGRLGAPRVDDPTCANRVEVLSVEDLDAMRPVLCVPGAAPSGEPPT